MLSKRPWLAFLLWFAVLVPLVSVAQKGTLEWEEMTSSALDKPRTFGIYLPPSYHTSDKVYPSFYVLHGKYQDATSRIGIRSTLNRMIQDGEIGEMIAVLVNGDELSFYRDEYETHIVHELVEHVDTHYRTIPDGASRGVTGYSMGAYGSMQLAFGHPEMFSVAVAQAIAAFSPADNPVPAFAVFWPASGEWYHQDIDTYLTQLQRLSGIKLVHGISDPQPMASVEAAREYHQLLLDKGIDHTYVEHPGGHVFIDEESLPFLSGHLHPVRQIAWLRQSVVHATGTLGQTLVDQPTPLEVEIRLDPPADLDGVTPHLTLDLSPLGGPAAWPLASSDGVRHLAGTTVTPARSGRYDLEMSMWPEFAWDLANARYPLLNVVLDVWPIDDTAVYVDACAPGWEATSFRVESLVIAQTGVVHTGAAACAVATQSSLAGWRLSFATTDPVHPFGFAGLRLAIHPGDLAPAEGDRLTVSLAGTGGVAVDLLDGIWVDWTRAEWQVVDIPMDAFQTENAITGIQFYGTPAAGTLYLDDVTFVAGRPPASTAVAESRTATNPRQVALFQNFPNPFNSDTVIRFALPATGRVELAIFNLAGQQMATLVHGVREAGAHTVRWDGRDDDRRKLASGVYLYRLRMGDRQQVETRKLLLIK